MSAIRPPVPSPLFPAQSPASPVRAARSDFFRAVLDGTGAAPAAAAETREVRVASTAPPPFEPSGERPIRPGSLLDIRI